VELGTQPFGQTFVSNYELVLADNCLFVGNRVSDGYPNIKLPGRDCKGCRPGGENGSKLPDV